MNPRATTKGWDEAKAAALIPWNDLRLEYARTGARSLKAFAEQHDVPYDSLSRRAKREGWKRLRDLEFARQRVRECETELAFARKVAALAGRYVIRLCRAVDLPLKDLAVDAWRAHLAVSDLWGAAAHLIDAQRELVELQAGRNREDAWLAARAGWDSTRWTPESAWPRFEVVAYRERGPASLPKKLTPAKLAIPMKRRAA
jgi:hypothetical protein